MTSDIQQQERRRFTRIAFDAKTELVQGERSWPVELIDISLHGLLLKESGQLNASKGQEYMAVVQLAGEEIELHLPVRLVHVHTPYLGMECKAMELESISHLRRLVELNLGDADLLDRELEHLVEQLDSHTD